MRFDQQPCTSTSCPVPAVEESSGKELVVYHESTEVQPVNTLKVKMILFINMTKVVMSMVNADEILEGEFVAHCLPKEKITILLNLNKEYMDELDNPLDVGVKDTEDVQVYPKYSI